MSGLADQLFRRESGRMLAALTRILGPANLGLAEDAVQDSLIRALELWPFQGIPENPHAWLITVARNRALDHLRREKILESNADAIVSTLESGVPDSNCFADDRLAMIFLCCHPALAPEARVTLTLKSVVGFGVREIARAFLLSPTAVAQRLVRAKRVLRAQEIVFEMPEGRDLEARLDSALEVIYLIFNEGYLAHGGEHLIRADLCEEAIFLGRLLANNPRTQSPRSHALLALMLLIAARLPSRLDGEGELLLLEEQDRTQWDQARIAEGMAQLERSARGDEESVYHIEAAIASAHHAKPVDWNYIAALYDDLLARKNTPVVALHRAVAVFKRDGPAAAIALLEDIEGHPNMGSYYLLPSALAELWLHLGDRKKAALYFGEALACECTAPERRRLESRAAAVFQRNVINAPFSMAEEGIEKVWNPAPSLIPER